jgi:serine protease Do
MFNRLLGIPIGLVVALMATVVNGSSARPLVPRNGQQAFRIATPGVSQVITQDVTPEIAQTLHMGPAEGALISEITDSPLRAGDVILSINGNPVRCESDLDAQLAQVTPGETFSVEVFRDGRIQTVTVRRATEIPPSPEVLAGAAEIRGIRVASLSTESGVIVTNVQIGTPASDAGLKSGDIILNVDGQPVRTANEFLGFLQQLNDRSATFAVQHSNGQVDFFAIPY